MTSPGASGVKAEMYSISRGTERIMSPVLVCWRRSPFTRVSSVSAAGSGISSVVTNQGPSGPVCGKFFPAVTECFW